MNEFIILGEFYFSRLLGKPIYDKTGMYIGRIRDMTVRWDSDYPRVIGIKYAKKIHKLIPIDYIEHCSEEQIKISINFSPKITVTIQEEDIYISKWLLDKQIIDLKGSKMVRVNDITLSWLQKEKYRKMILVAVDIGVRGLFRRLGLEFLFKKYKNNLLGWQYIKPLESWNSYLQLKREKQQLNILHPADIADLLEEMDYKHRAAIIDNLDTKKAIDTLTEMDIKTQVELIKQMDKKRAVNLLEDMPPDEAADILAKLSYEKLEELLKLMELDNAEEIRKLMKYKEGTAGALMTTEFISFPANLTVEQVIHQLRKLAPTAETIYYLYVVDIAKHLLGVISLRELIVAMPENILEELMNIKVAFVNPDDDYNRVAEIINKYGLIAVPVIDEHNIMLGIVTVDDVLDILIPEREKLDTYSLFALSKWGGKGR